MRDLKVYFTGIMSGKLFRERRHSLVLMIKGNSKLVKKESRV